MPRSARIIIPGYPHHVTQRGNRRMQTFFSDQDYLAYTHFLKKHCANCGVAIWGWCLMPNHVHLLLVPDDEKGLTRTMARTHRSYTFRINTREGWRGHLWQGRYGSYPLDESHFYQAARYIDLNPVRAALVDAPEDWPWSSARSRILHTSDLLLDPACPLGKMPSLEVVDPYRRRVEEPDSDDGSLKEETHLRGGACRGRGDTYRSRAFGPALSESVPLGDALAESVPPGNTPQDRGHDAKAQERSDENQDRGHDAKAQERSDENASCPQTSSMHYSIENVRCPQTSQTLNVQNTTPDPSFKPLHFDEIPNWAEFLAQGIDADAIKAIRSHERSGRPIGSKAFLQQIGQKYRK